jgi:hypothetical protein
LVQDHKSAVVCLFIYLFVCFGPFVLLPLTLCVRNESGVSASKSTDDSVRDVLVWDLNTGEISQRFTGVDLRNLWVFES